MKEPIYVIVFKFGDGNYLLFTEIFMDGRFSFSPTCYATVEEAAAVFEDFRRIIWSAENPGDPEVAKQTAKLVGIYPVIHKIDPDMEKLKEFTYGHLDGVQVNFELLNAPYRLLKMKKEFEQFAVLDIAMDICNWTTVGPGGHMNIYRTERIWKNDTDTEININLWN